MLCHLTIQNVIIFYIPYNPEILLVTLIETQSLPVCRLYRNTCMYVRKTKVTSNGKLEDQKSESV